MRIATILPVAHLWLEEDNDYHMALAHLVGHDEDYDHFFRSRIGVRGNHVIMDNGVVETGWPMPYADLIRLGHEIHANEIILPDMIGERETTLEWGAESLSPLKQAGFDILAVPQGKDLRDWLSCLDTMLEWNVSTIGISRFGPDSRHNLVSGAIAAIAGRGLKTPIHLLGCNDDPIVAYRLDMLYTGSIRGIDSGVASFYSKGDYAMSVHGWRPDVEVNFLKDKYDPDLISYNRSWWRMRLRGRIAS